MQDEKTRNSVEITAINVLFLNILSGLVNFAWKVPSPFLPVFTAFHYWHFMSDFNHLLKWREFQFCSQYERTAGWPFGPDTVWDFRHSRFWETFVLTVLPTRLVVNHFATCNIPSQSDCVFTGWVFFDMILYFEYLWEMVRCQDSCIAALRKIDWPFRFLNRPFLSILRSSVGIVFEEDNHHVPQKSWLHFELVSNGPQCWYTLTASYLPASYQNVTDETRNGSQ